MKIMHVVECAGGVDRYLSMLLPLLEEQQVEQILVCSFNYSKSKYEKWIDEVVQIDMQQTFSFIEIWKRVKEIRRYIKQIHPDILYCHSSFAGGLGRLAAIGLSCKVVYNPHGWAFNIKRTG